MTDDLELVAKLHKDTRQAYMELNKGQVRFIVDLFYQLQEQRKALRNQERALEEAGEPTTVVTHFAEQVYTLEKQVVPIMDRWTDTQTVGAWSKSVKGVGAILAAGLLAHIDMEKTPAISSLWRYAGLDPTIVWNKGEKRPFNAKLKTLCVRPDQHVTTDRGYVPISEVQVGDLVLTHRGRWKPVTNVYQRWYDGDMYKIVSHGTANQGPWVTEDHPMLVRRHPMMSLSQGWKRSDYTKRRKQWERAEKVRELVAEGKTQREVAKTMNLSEASVSLIVSEQRHATKPAKPEVGWSAVDQVKLGWDVLRPTVPSDTETVKLRFVSFPSQRVHLPDSVEVDDRLARLIGLYLAEGHSTPLRNCMAWSFHIDEKAYGREVKQTVLDYFGITVKREPNVANNAQQLWVHSRAMAKSFGKTFGHGAHDKAPPYDWLWKLDGNLIRSLLEGLYDGDGTYDSSGRILTTVSQQLAYWTSDAIRRLGEYASVHHSKGVYKVRWTTFSKSVESTPTGSWHPVSGVESEHYSGYVYNLEVNEDESYVVEGLASHNCWKISDSFVKVSGYEDAFYGQLYKQRKAYEVQRNENGELADQAAHVLETKNITSKVQRPYYEAGKLPPLHVENRARRWTVKLFLAHWFEVAYEAHYGEAPPAPYAIAHLGHKDKIEVPQLYDVEV